ncbi:MAG TPA: MFS transporter [Candidatus Binataceae bacterium]|nr:MFS transporter [Candidatus Binataceae bacterium]
MGRFASVEVDSPRAWVVLGAAFITGFTIFGIAYSFGAFFKPIADEFSAGRGATSALFSITAFTYFGLSSVTGHMADRFGPRPVLAAGAVVMGVGLALTSRIDRLWVGYLTYGSGVGIGVACGYVPMIAAVGGWFRRRRNAALAIAVTGAGGGTLAVAPLAAALIERYGWRTTYLAFGVAAATILMTCAALTPRPPTHVEASELSLSEAIRTRAFALLYLASLLTGVALFVPMVFLPAFAQGQGVGKIAAAALVGFIGGSSMIGRLGLGTLSDRIGCIRLYQLSFLVVGLSFFIWLSARSYAWLVIFAVTMGAGYGGYVGLAPAVVVELFGIRRLGRVLGALYTSAGFAALMGPPLAGFIIDRTGSFHWAIVGSLAMGMAAFVALVPLQTNSGIAVPVAEAK